MFGTGSQHKADFVWASGAPVTFTDWNQGEPNNDPNWGGEYYGIIQTYVFDTLQPGLWNDQNNTASGSSDYGVVEIVPEPSVASCFTIAAVGLLPRRRRTYNASQGNR